MVAKRLVLFTALMVGLAGVGHAFAATRAVSGTRTSPHASANRSAADINVAQPHAAPIPKVALRLRIIANSDSPADQRVKLQVRNAVVLQVAGWLESAKSEPQAQSILEQHVAQIEALATRVVREKGFAYAVRTDIARVPFPTKIYGNQVYPAGDYEALRITLGKGLGANWWCVLFPPLCFIDIAEGDAIPNTGGFPDLPPLETLQIPGPTGKLTTVQVRLASLDYGEELWHAVRLWWQGHHHA